MDKRYQVFVSSTFEDLREERNAVIQALLELDCIPAGMEMFPASDDDQWTLIKQVIDDCDYYVIIVGGRYGSTTAEGISFTEREFDYAVDQDIPILAFTHRQPDLIPAGKTEASEDARKKLSAFRDKVRSERVVREWSSPEELGGQVSRSLVKTIKTHPAEGWVRGRHAATKETLEQINTLQQENEKLKEQVKGLKNTAPEGSEQYASGADDFEVSGIYSVGPYGSRTDHRWTFNTFWNGIFAEIGPLLFNEASETRMKRHLCESFIRFSQDREHDLSEVKSVQIYTTVWQTIIVQLRALGLIQKSRKTHGVNDTDTYWTLTPYGEELLTKLRAIKKGAPPTEVVVEVDQS